VIGQKNCYVIFFFGPPLQHINYVSLREVLGASFSSIQQAQQNSTVAQPNMVSHLQVPLSSNTKFLPETNVVPIQSTVTAAPQMQTYVPNSGFNDPQFSQSTACRFADQPAMHSSAKTSFAADQYHASQRQPYSAMVAGVNNQVLLKFLL